MSHDYHQGQPNYNQEQLYFDGCAECAQRAADPVLAITYIKDIKRAWTRATRFEKDWLVPEELPVSETEAPILHLLWCLQVVLERQRDLPIGVVPGSLDKLLEDASQFLVPPRGTFSVACPRACGERVFG